ncbi:hypothetical protein B6A10_04180 [Flavobacterium sp. L1I52]|uniref:Lipocalin-like domain-containing protein n=1 Tax=Flavobacterium pokkalii TaxID=1940408 RepID=A0ABR7UPN3_9FLAO|nr:hypothetical protein [Flavobacterium pokkalii]MBD0724371.1 hypothetical protein [Flavobacterium pokkalii]
MKKLVLILLLVSYSCGTDASGLDDYEHSGGVVPYALSTKLNASTWKITFFSNNGLEETSLYSSYVFKFNKNEDVLNVNSGKVEVNYQANKYEGIWSVYQKIISYNPSQEVLEFGCFIALSFVSPNDLLKIEGEWQSVMETNTKIVFVKKFNNEIVSYLTFEKY